MRGFEYEYGHEYEYEGKTGSQREEHGGHLDTLKSDFLICGCFELMFSGRIWIGVLGIGCNGTVPYGGTPGCSQL